MWLICLQLVCSVKQRAHISQDDWSDRPVFIFLHLALFPHFFFPLLVTFFLLLFESPFCEEWSCCISLAQFNKAWPVLVVWGSVVPYKINSIILAWFFIQVIWRKIQFVFFLSRSIHQKVSFFQYGTPQISNGIMKVKYSHISQIVLESSVLSYFQPLDNKESV